LGQNYEEQLGTMKMLPLIFRMSIPAVAAQLVNLLYGIVDRIYIGHIAGIGTDALAGVGVTNSIIIMISAFSMIVGGGGPPLASIALGAGDRKKAEKILENGFLMLIFFTIIMTTVSYVFMEPILRLTGASDQTIGYGMQYLKIYLTGTLFVQTSIGLNSFISAQGRPKVAMVSVMMGAALNILLDPLFIFGFHMGVAGAALATVIAQFFSALWVLSFLFSKRATLRIRVQRKLPDFRIIGSIAALGVSPFIMSITESLIGFIMNGTLVHYGDIYVSALTVMQSAMQIAGAPLIGFGQGTAPIISYNYGHGDKKRVKEGFKIMITIMASFNFLLILLILLFPSVVAGMFTSDPELIRTVERVMPFFLTGMMVFGLQRACQNMFVALGQAKVSLFIALLRKVFLLIPLVFILSPIIGVNGVYLAESIADATAATLCTIIFMILFPKILKKLDYRGN